MAGQEAGVVCNGVMPEYFITNVYLGDAANITDSLSFLITVQMLDVQVMFIFEKLFNKHLAKFDIFLCHVGNMFMTSCLGPVSSINTGAVASFSGGGTLHPLLPPAQVRQFICLGRENSGMLFAGVTIENLPLSPHEVGLRIISPRS